MTILLEQFTIPQQGLVELKLDRSFQIDVTIEHAQRKVNRWLLLEVGNMLISSKPTLVIGDSVVWRVPILLTATHVGTVGTVGEIDVDVQSGAILLNADKVTELQQRAVELGQHLPPYSPRTEIPQQFLTKNVIFLQVN